MYCEFCGNKIEEGSVFCSVCGNPVGGNPVGGGQNRMALTLRVIQLRTEPRLRFLHMIVQLCLVIQICLVVRVCLAELQAREFMLLSR